MAMHNAAAARKVVATPRKGGSLSKGNRYSLPTGPTASLAHKDLQRMHGTPSAYEVRGNPFAPGMPSQGTLDKLADRTMAGLGTAAPTKGGHWGKVCPSCGMQRSRTNLCDCNS
jgi:hypothetical protein